MLIYVQIPTIGVYNQSTSNSNPQHYTTHPTVKVCVQVIYNISEKEINAALHQMLTSQRIFMSCNKNVLLTSLQINAKDAITVTDNTPKKSMLDCLFDI